jgi:hypothetical protein
VHTLVLSTQTCRATPRCKALLASRKCNEYKKYLSVATHYSRTERWIGQLKSSKNSHRAFGDCPYITVKGCDKDSFHIVFLVATKRHQGFQEHLLFTSGWRDKHFSLRFFFFFCCLLTHLNVATELNSGAFANTTSFLFFSASAFEGQTLTRSRPILLAFVLSS